MAQYLNFKPMWKYLCTILLCFLNLNQYTTQNLEHISNFPEFPSKITIYKIGNFIFLKLILKKWIRSISVGIFAIGGMIGGLASGWFADKLGRKKALLYNNAIAIAGAAFLTFAKSPADVYYLIIIGRFIMGLNSGNFFIILC